MRTWDEPRDADALSALLPAPGPTAFAALSTTGRMPILQGIVLFFGALMAEGVAFALAAPLRGSIGQSGVALLAALFGVVLAVLVYFVAARFIGARPACDFESQDSLREGLTGILLGALLMCAVAGIAAAADAYRVVGVNAHSLIAVSAGQSILAAVCEEIAFRAGLLRLLEHRLGTWWALGLTSALFGAAHLLNPEAGWWGALAICLEAGILLGACYIVTRRLWFVIGVHAAWNFTQGGILSSDVSGTGSEHSGLLDAVIDGPWWLTGGSAGFEGSLSAILVCLVTGLALLALAHRRGLVIPRGAFRHEVLGPCGPVDVDEPTDNGGES